MKRWILPLMLSAGLALAATVNITDTYVFQALFRPWTRTTTQLPTASAWTGYVAFNTTKGVATVSDGTDWRSMSPQLGIATWDFPPLGGGGVNCAESATLAKTGAAYTDACLATTDLAMDGGSALLYLNATFSCRALTNGVVFKACAWAADGGTPGTLDLPDAGYFARVIH